MRFDFIIFVTRGKSHSSTHCFETPTTACPRAWEKKKKQVSKYTVLYYSSSTHIPSGESHGLYFIALEGTIPDKPEFPEIAYV